MKKEENSEYNIDELDEEDKAHIADVFLVKIVPKLRKHDARLGNLSCGFAGERYRHWTLQFKSVRSGFEIVEFTYDEEGDNIDLDL